jgi:transcriptional regulator with XRE-family HTH domain
MTGGDLKTVRSLANWTQAEGAQRLGVTQAYLSMVERGTRPVSDELAAVALKVYPLPATARLLGVAVVIHPTEEFFKNALGELGYPGFSYLKRRASLNPAELLLFALDTQNLDSRVTEALPWLPFQFPEMNWEWLTREAKLRDRQNRLAFVTELGRQVAEAKADTRRAEFLAARVAVLERSRLANEDTLCKESMSEVERRWVRSHRSRAARHWNLLTDLKREDLSHVYSEIVKTSRCGFGSKCCGAVDAN